MTGTGLVRGLDPVCGVGLQDQIQCPGPDALHGFSLPAGSCTLGWSEPTRPLRPAYAALGHSPSCLHVPNLAVILHVGSDCGLLLSSAQGHIVWFVGLQKEELFWKIVQKFDIGEQQ